MAGLSPSEPLFRQVRIHASRPLSSTVRSVVLETADGADLQWAGGQYVELLMPTDVLDEAPERWRAEPDWLREVKATKHPYSIASAPDPDAPGRLELAVGKNEGDSTTALLQRLPPGVQLGMVGPLGEFTRVGLCDDPAVFVATGTGVAPLRAMIMADLARRAEGPELLLLFGCRREEDLLWDDAFRALAARHPRFRYEPTLSQPTPSWAGRRGYVQDHLADIMHEVGPLPVFVAGRSEMVADVLRILEIDIGLPPDRIRREQYA